MHLYKNPPDGESSDDSISFFGDGDEPMYSDSDMSQGVIGADDSDDSDFDLTDDSDDSEDEAGTEATAGGGDGASAAAAGGSAIDDLNEEDEEDETVRAIIAAIKKPRTVPPEIKLDDFVTDLSFHPTEDILAIATITGDVLFYKYANAENTLLKSIEVHSKACRDVEFSEDGRVVYSASKDKSIMLTDMETEKLRKFYDNAHDEPINKLYIIDENLFTTGDDAGMVKMWDIRTDEPVFALKEVEDYISAMLTNEAKKHLLVTSGDGLLTTLNLGSRKMFVQSEPYSEELTSMGMFRGDSKVVVGTSKGRMYTFNWGEFGYHCDMFPGMKSPISSMLPVTDRIACVAGEEGVIRAAHIAPFRNLGIVGQHTLPVESMDINCSGELIASSSHNNDIRFWNIKYFEEFGDIKYNAKHNNYKDSLHNLPSSKYSNTQDFFADLAKEDD